MNNDGFLAKLILVLQCKQGINKMQLGTTTLLMCLSGIRSQNS
jgi:hypothetical protein